MILQHLTLPNDECKDYHLYADKEIGKFPISLNPGESITFRGFMNAFSITKWKKYTNINTLKLSIDCIGEYQLSFINNNGSTSHKCKDKNVITVPIETDYGLINVRITALTTTMIISGSYTTDITPNEIKLALNVCTYHRPEYIEKKKETFQKAIEQYDLPDDTEMFIIDNASELDVELDDPRIHIFHNPNTGGSGGISRGIQEICSNKEVTHIILMDDDTIVEPECLFRTWSFLSCLKKEYEDSAIAGTMLLMEKPNTIYESGTVFEDPGDGIPRCRSLKHMLNVSDDEGCLTFDREEKIDYNGWWFCVYPTSFANPNNLPMRLFIRYDDVEYGLRFGKQFITLNGISTWHSNFNKNNNPITLYYSIRNHLILLRKTGINVKKYEKKKIKDALSLVKRGDCASASAIKDAIQDSKHFDPNNNDGIVSLQTYGRIRLAIMLLLRLFG